MLNPDQIKLIQTAVRAAGLRTAADDSRYRLLLRQYHCESCKQLNQVQLDDILAICERLGWRHPGKPADHYRAKTARSGNSGIASDGQLAKLRRLSDGLGWPPERLSGFIARMTRQQAILPEQLAAHEAHNIIEALKAMYRRTLNRSHYSRNS